MESWKMDVPLETREMGIIKRILRRRKIRERYLEIGCGDGFALVRLSGMGLNGIGVDLSRESLKLASKRKIKNTRLLEGDFMKMKFDKFNLVFLLNVLEHVDDDRLMLKKINKTMNRGGHLFIAVPAHKKLYGFADINAGHIRRYDYRNLNGKLKNSGFKVIDFMSLGFPVCNFYTWLFNLYGKAFGKEKSLKKGKTLVSGIESKGDYYPKPIEKIARMAFPLLSILIRMDYFFLKTRLGNHFLVHARKYR